MARVRSDKPNVVVLFTDQQRWDTAGVHVGQGGLAAPLAPRASGKPDG